MLIKLQYFLRLCSLIIAIIISLPAYSLRAEQYHRAVAAMKTLVHMQGEDAVTPLLTQWGQMTLPCCEHSQQQRYLFARFGLQKWGVTISEFEDLIGLLYSFETEEYRKLHQASFDKNMSVIEDFRHRVNALVARFHPGLQVNAKTLRNHYRGQGQVIAVFDVFDDSVLEKQRGHYPQASVEALKCFGDPIHFDHGNSVIDIILEIAPQVSILPVSTDASHYYDAMNYLNRRDDVKIINMSRAFAAKDGQLDGDFAEALSHLLETKLVVKSIGNTGTDLDGKVTPLRRERGLPATGNLFAYDLDLIKAFLGGNTHSENLLLAINLDLMLDNIALSATIPGDFQLASAQSLALVADGLFTWSSDNYESGSSFAAPQLSAIAALLWQAVSERGTDASVNDIRQALLDSAKDLYPLTTDVIGRGMIDGDGALATVESGVLMVSEKSSSASQLLERHNLSNRVYEVLGETYQTAMGSKLAIALAKVMKALSRRLDNW